MVCFVNTYPLNSDLYGGERYSAFKQLTRDGQGSLHIRDTNILYGKTHMACLHSFKLLVDGKTAMARKSLYLCTCILYTTVFDARSTILALKLLNKTL